VGSESVSLSFTTVRSSHESTHQVVRRRHHQVPQAREQIVARGKRDIRYEPRAKAAAGAVVLEVGLALLQHSSARII
jgi:hypothetical protein